MRMIELETLAPKLFCIVLDIVGPPSPSPNVSISGQGFSKATCTADLRWSRVTPRASQSGESCQSHHDRFQSRSRGLRLSSYTAF